MKLTGSSQKIEDPNEALAKRGSSLTDISVTDSCPKKVFQCTVPRFP